MKLDDLRLTEGDYEEIHSYIASSRDKQIADAQLQKIQNVANESGKVICFVPDSWVGFRKPRNKMSMASKLLYATAEEARQDLLQSINEQIEIVEDKDETK